MMGRILAGAIVLLAFTAQPAAALAEAVFVEIENTVNGGRPAGPATFGMPFARGDAKGPMKLGNLPTQFDIKRHWPDGSVKHAVVTVQLPALPKGARQKQTFVADTAAAPQAVAPDSYQSDLKGLEDVVVKIYLHDGPLETASLAKTMEQARPDRLWLAGPLVREWHFKAVPVSPGGVPDDDLDVRFEVRAYPAAKRARVAVIVENTHWRSPGNIAYDVQIAVGGKPVFGQLHVGRFTADPGGAPLKTPLPYAGHAGGARWVKRFWVGSGQPNPAPLDTAHVRYDTAYLGRTGLVPKYDPALAVPEKVLADVAKRWSAAATDPLQNGFITPGFGNTGARDDIGPLPAWTARYLVSQDPRARAATLGNGDLSGGCPIHVRDRDTDWTISLDGHPGFSFSEGGTAERVARRDATGQRWVMPAGSPFQVDHAHQPSLAYVPYLVTGDYYYLEEVQFWANWNMLDMHREYRGQAKGILKSEAIQIRGVAWGLRQILHAAAVTPDVADSKPRSEYFEAKLHNNLAYYRDFLDGKLDFQPNPIGSFPPAVGHAYGEGAAKDRFGTTAGWMQNFLAWTFAHAVQQGYNEAIPARDYFAKLAIGSMTHPDEITPFAGTAYFLPLADRPGSDPNSFFKRWSEVKSGFEKMGTPLPASVSYPELGSSNSYIARGVLIETARAGLPGAAAALNWLDGQLPNRRAILASDPTWAFLPP